MREGGCTEIYLALVGRISTLVGYAADVGQLFVVCPNVEQIKPMPDLVRCGTAKIERSLCSSNRAKCVCPYDIAVERGRPARESCEAQEVVCEVGDPHVQISVRGPRIRAARRH